jgi:hypothetical protein
MSKPTKATNYIHQAAGRCRNAGISIDWDSSFETVAISCKGEEDIFMQGAEAGEFIREIEATCKRFPSLDEYTAALSMSEQYAECIWG